MTLSIRDRIMLRICCRKRSCCVSVFILLFVIVITIRAFIKNFQCSSEESIKTINNLCREYHKGNVVGNICQDICDTHTMQFDACTNYQGGKSVFRMKWKDKIVMLKAKKENIYSYEMPCFDESLSDLIHMVADSISFNHPFARTRMSEMQLFTKVWKDSIQKYIIHRLSNNGESISWSHGACSSIWSLIQQDEYQLFALFDNYTFFPKLYGTCGHFYAVSYMPTGDLLSPYSSNLLQIWNRPWKERAALAMKLLDLMQSFDEGFPETLHMCDMKGENFGISEDGSVGAIDVDMAIFDRKLKSDLLSPNCTVHDDCGFFDCHGWCDISTQQCTGIRTNNNLQILCEKLLQNHRSNAFTGLLHSPPSTVPELKTALAECAVPVPVQLPGCTKAGNNIRCFITSDKYPIRHRADKALYSTFQKLIERSLK